MEHNRNETIFPSVLQDMTELIREIIPSHSGVSILLCVQRYKYCPDTQV